MHELKIAMDMSAIVIETARKENLSRVSRINVVFGELVQIIPEIFESAFRETVKGSPASDSELSVEILPVMLRCKTCGIQYNMKGSQFECPECKSMDIDIIQGKELFIKSIEGE